jgi:hypothetical protein
VPTATALAAALALQETLKLAQERSLSRSSFPTAGPYGFWRRLLSLCRELQRRGQGQGQGEGQREEREKKRLLQKFRNSFFSLRQPELLSVSPLPAPEILLSPVASPPPPAAAAVSLWNYFTVSSSLPLSPPLLSSLWSVVSLSLSLPRCWTRKAKSCPQKK